MPPLESESKTPKAPLESPSTDPEEKIPSITPPKVERRGGARPGSGRKPKVPNAPLKAAKEPEPEPITLMPIPRGLTDTLGEAPYMLIGMGYAKKTGRPLPIPGGQGEIKLMGPEQLGDFKKAGAEAWDIMVREWNWQLPPWMVYLLCVGLTAGGAMLLDQLGAAMEVINSDPAKRAEFDAKMKGLGIKPPVVPDTGTNHIAIPAPEKPAQPAPVTA